MTTYKKKKLKDREGNYIVTPSSADIVYCQDGSTVEQKLNNIENDEFSPTITQVESMAKVGVGTDVDVSANVQEGYVKSAILTGQTLVNIFNNWVNNVGTLTPVQTQDGYFLFTGNNKYARVNLDDIPTFKRGAEYTFIYRIKNSTYDGENNNSLRLEVGATTIYAHTVTNGIWKIKKSFSTDETNCFVKVLSWMGSTGSAEVSLQIIEGDYTNVDIPYFEGMQSVKLPVLTTTGKNLFDGVLERGGINSNYGSLIETDTMIRAKNMIELQSNRTYTISKTKGLQTITVVVYDENKKYSRTLWNKTFTLSPTERYVKFTDSENDLSNSYQIEESPTPTPYEPYKSNILTVNEELELRGNGNVKDELDLLTGEVTERIGEDVLDGSENWTFVRNDSITSVFESNIKLNTTTSKDLICDKIDGTFYNIFTDGKESIKYTSRLFINILNSKATTVDELKIYLKSNPITIQYELATESIKTVDLTPGGTNPTTKPYVWDDGHIQLSSEEGSLTPSLEYSVTTSRGGQIIQNTQSIAKQDKRVYDLEMLLINASIDETYKRLTLQNDVMVMNRECQTVASPLRYIMLQRLIEEKAYETQDMLDKLDVFFMYGEITDEQYFELFDIVLGVMTDTDLDITEEVE